MLLTHYSKINKTKSTANWNDLMPQYNILISFIQFFSSQQYSKLFNNNNFNVKYRFVLLFFSLLFFSFSLHVRHMRNYTLVLLDFFFLFSQGFCFSLFLCLYIFVIYYNVSFDSISVLLICTEVDLIDTLIIIHAYIRTTNKYLVNK